MVSDVTLVVAVVLAAFSVFGFTLAYVQWITGPGAMMSRRPGRAQRRPARQVASIGEHRHA